MRISYPNIIPVAGGIAGLAIGISYYLGIMISQLFIMRPPSTWIIGLLWLPVLVVKPGLIGFVVGLIVWLLIRPFHKPRSLSSNELKALKIFFALLIVVSAAIGVAKIIKLSY